MLLGVVSLTLIAFEDTVAGLCGGSLRGWVLGLRGGGAQPRSGNHGAGHCAPAQSAIAARWARPPPGGLP